MLSAPNRMVDAGDFRAAVRGGRRSGSRTLVVHAATPGGVVDADAGTAPRVGFVVSRAVGNAVVRNRVRRRLRHLVRDRLPALVPGSQVVVRALPAAADASYDHLARDLDRCFGTGPGSRTTAGSR